MGIAKGPLILSNKPTTNCANSSMSHDYHQGIFSSFSNALDKSPAHLSAHLPPQIRRDKLRPDAFADDDALAPVADDIDQQHHQQFHHVYAAPGGAMLSEMFNFPPPPTAVEFSNSFRTLRPQPPPPPPPNSAAAAAAMQLFLMNPPPPPPRSPSPPSTSSTLHMLLPNPPTPLHGFDGEAAFGQFAVVESQGLSLSLHSSSSLDAAKADELRIRDSGFLYNYNQVHGGGGGSGSAGTSSILQYSYRNSENSHGGQINHVGFGSSLGVVNVLRNSKFAKPAQELLEEFCSVGRVQLKKSKFGSAKQNPDPETAATGASSSSKDQPPPLSAADRIEHQRRKVKLLSMLDEARISLSIFYFFFLLPLSFFS